MQGCSTTARSIFLKKPEAGDNPSLYSFAPMAKIPVSPRRGKSSA
jgi:hypothetical protein